MAAASGQASQLDTRGCIMHRPLAVACCQLRTLAFLLPWTRPVGTYYARTAPANDRASASEQCAWRNHFPTSATRTRSIDRRRTRPDPTRQAAEERRARPVGAPPRTGPRSRPSSGVKHSFKAPPKTRPFRQMRHSLPHTRVALNIKPSEKGKERTNEHCTHESEPVRDAREK